MKPILYSRQDIERVNDFLIVEYGFGLTWLGVAIAALAVRAYREIRFRLALRGLMREANEAAASHEEVMW